MSIYVASSWQNVWQPGVVTLLRAWGHAVYNIRASRPRAREFPWVEIDPSWPSWSPRVYRAALKHPVAENAFANDFSALDACHACVLVAPCGGSAYLELGFAVGQRKRTAIFFPQGVDDPGKHPLSPIDPEHMAKMAGRILIDVQELKEWAEGLGGPPTPSRSNARRRARDTKAKRSSPKGSSPDDRT